MKLYNFNIFVIILYYLYVIIIHIINLLLSIISKWDTDEGGVYTNSINKPLKKHYIILKGR